MKKKGVVIGLLAIVALIGFKPVFAGEKKMTNNTNPKVVMETSEGKITIALCLKFAKEVSLCLSKRSISC